MYYFQQDDKVVSIREITSTRCGVQTLENSNVRERRREVGQQDPTGEHGRLWGEQTERAQCRGVSEQHFLSEP